MPEGEAVIKVDIDIKKTEEKLKKVEEELKDLKKAREELEETITKPVIGEEKEAGRREVMKRTSGGMGGTMKERRKLDKALKEMAERGSMFARTLKFFTKMYRFVYTTMPILGYFGVREFSRVTRAYETGGGVFAGLQKSITERLIKTEATLQVYGNKMSKYEKSKLILRKRGLMMMRGAVAGASKIFPLLIFIQGIFVLLKIIARFLQDQKTILNTSLKLLKRGIGMILRPILDILGIFLLPLAIALVLIGAEIIKNLRFIYDWVKGAVELGRGIHGAIMWVAGIIGSNFGLIAMLIAPLPTVFFMAMSYLQSLLSPILESIPEKLAWLGGVFSGYWDRFISWINSIKLVLDVIRAFIIVKIQEIIQTVMFWFEVIKIVLGMLWEGLVNAFWSAVEWLFNGLKYVWSLIQGVLDWIRSGIESVGDIINSVVEKLGEVYDIIYNTISSVLSEMSDMLSNIYNGIKQLVGGIGDAVGGAVETVTSAVGLSSVSSNLSVKNTTYNININASLNAGTNINEMVRELDFNIRRRWS